MNGLKEKHINPELFKAIKEIGNLLGKTCTVDILQYLSINDPVRYKNLKNVISCDDNMLSRRLKKLKEYHLIKQLKVCPEKREIYEYTLTTDGAELIKSFNIFIQNKGESK